MKVRSRSNDFGRQIGTRETLGRAGMPQSRGEHFVKSRITGRVAYLTVDHPPLNAISVEIMQALAELVRAHDRDDNVRIVLDSAGQKPPFAADAGTLFDDPSWEAQFRMLRDGQSALSAIEFSTTPVVMAIYNGVCMGGGLELALACHVRVAGTGTVFSAPEAVAGAMPGWGNTQRLVSYLGRPRTIELALTGGQITANEAHAFGAVNHVVAGSKVLAKASEIAERIAHMRTKSIKSIMTAMHVPYRHGLRKAKRSTSPVA